jgi:hypothetical protein
VEPPFGAVADGEVLAGIGARLGLEGFDGGFDAASVSKELAQEVPAFAGRSLSELSEEGAPAAAGESTEP